MRKWYAVHTQQLKERKARAHLMRQGFAVYLPVYRKIRRHARRKEIVSAPLFPRYLFIHLDLEFENWIPVNSTVGVCNIVCLGGPPVAIPENIIELIKGREDEKGYVLLNNIDPLKKGDKVQIEQGPLAERVGIFERMKDNERVIVMLQLLGRPIEVLMPKQALISVS